MNDPVGLAILLLVAVGGFVAYQKWQIAKNAPNQAQLTNLAAQGLVYDPATGTTSPVNTNIPDYLGH